MRTSAAIDVAYRDEGPRSAPVLVLSCSLGSTLALWEPILPAIRGVRVLRYDHRGHGKSPVPDGPYTMADLGGDLLRLLDRAGIERAAICGLSLGGMVAMWVAANAPERVERLILFSTSARLGPPGAWRERAETVRRAGTGAVADAVVARWFTPGFAVRRPEFVSAMRAMIASTPPEGYAACSEAIAEWDFESRLAAIRAPTLVVAGVSDPATPLPHARAIASGIPGARVVVIDDAAHVPVGEQPGAVAELLMTELSPRPLARYG